MKKINFDLKGLQSVLPKDKFLSMKCGNARVIITSGPISIPRHMDDIHEHYELLIPLTEFSSVYIDKKKMECKPGQILVINPGQQHGSNKNMRKALFISIFFERGHMEQLIAEITGDDQQFPNYVQDLKPEIQDLVSLMIEEYRESRAGRARLLSALSEQLAVYMVRNYHQPAFAADMAEDGELPFYQSRYSEVIDYMRMHLGEKITIDQMADITMMNRYHFIRSFRSSFGSSPYDYLTSLRISHAKNLLANTALTVSEIGSRCGFFSASRFSAAFRNSTGMTPSKYRKHASAEKTTFAENKGATTAKVDLIELQQNLVFDLKSE